MRRGVLLLLLLLALPGAASQGDAGGCRAPVLSFPEPPRQMEPGGTYTLPFAIENPNAPPVDSVRATLVLAAPAGWSAIPAARELTLGPHNVSFDAIAITAPNRGNGEPAGNVTLHVTFVCTTGDTLTTSSADETIPVSIATFQAPWTVVLPIFAILAVLVLLLGLRRLRRGVAIVPARLERDVEPGKSVKYTFRVENRRGKPQRFALLPVGVPPGWSLSLALEDVELEPGEEKALWAVLKAAPDASAGQEVAVQLRLESPRGAREVPSTTLLARVVVP